MKYYITIEDYKTPEKALRVLDAEKDESPWFLEKDGCGDGAGFGCCVITHKSLKSHKSLKYRFNNACRSLNPLLP